MVGRAATKEAKARAAAEEAEAKAMANAAKGLLKIIMEDKRQDEGKNSKHGGVDVNKFFANNAKNGAALLLLGAAVFFIKKKFDDAMVGRVAEKEAKAKARAAAEQAEAKAMANAAKGLFNVPKEKKDKKD
ncbi:hypothetical protein TSUD_47460 [Trifolium subterraneum]|nr:hypothetical protein TSUD_47460 [Trifolium subterraneum]